MNFLKRARLDKKIFETERGLAPSKKKRQPRSSAKAGAGIMQLTFGNINELHSVCNTHAGFIYKIVITNPTNALETYEYFGKKSFRGKGVGVNFNKQSDWATYRSSSKNIEEYLNKGYNAVYTVVEIVGAANTLAAIEQKHIAASWTRLFNTGDLEKSLNMDSGWGKYSKQDWYYDQMHKKTNNIWKI